MISSGSLGLVILAVLVVSKFSGVGLASWDYFAFSVGLFLVVSFGCLVWLRNKFFMEIEKESFEKIVS